MRKLTSILMLGVLISACTTSRKAEKFYNKHPDELAKIAAERFPVKPSYISGKIIHTRDTVPGDSVPCPEAKPDPITGVIQPVKVKCPPSFRDTIFKTDTIYLENTAKSRMLQDENKDLLVYKSKAEAERDLFQKDNRIYRWVTAGMGLLILSLVFIIIRKF